MQASHSLFRNYIQSSAVIYKELKYLQISFMTRIMDWREFLSLASIHVGLSIDALHL